MVQPQDEEAGFSMGACASRHRRPQSLTRGCGAQTWCGATRLWVAWAWKLPRRPRPAPPSRASCLRRVRAACAPAESHTVWLCRMAWFSGLTLAPPMATPWLTRTARRSTTSRPTFTAAARAPPRTRRLW